MIEIRSSDDGSNWTLTGLASTYGQSYDVRDQHGRYKETVLPGAFAGATSGKDTVELRVEHNHVGAPLAATGRSATMTLAERSDGLLLTATLPKDDPDVVAAVSKAQRGLLDRMSVGFHSAQSDWNDDKSHRTIRSATLAEVSLVHQPANPGAVVAGVRHIGDEELEIRYVAALSWAAGTLKSDRRAGSVPYDCTSAYLAEIELQLRGANFRCKRRPASYNAARRAAELAELKLVALARHR